MAKKKKRIGYAVKPPYIDLGEALELAQKIYDDGGGSISEDQFSTITKNSLESSSFRLKVGALRAFGLISQVRPGARIDLSEVGRSFAGSVTPEQRAGALKAAFLSIPNHRTLFEFWSGKLLPQDEFFLNSIRERCKVPAELVPSWKNTFMKSAKAAGLLQERPDGRVQLRREPGSAEEEPVPTNETTEKLQREVSPRAPVVRRDEVQVERFPIPLAGEGKSATIELPKGWTPADVRKMIHVIEAMFLWEAGGAQNKNP